MRRREFIILAGFGVAWPLAARAQEPGRVYRLGSLFTVRGIHPSMPHFLTGCGAMVFSKAKTFCPIRTVMDCGRNSWRPTLPEIVNQKVDMMVCAGDSAIRAVPQATQIIPILGSTEDMLGSGLVHSMASITVVIFCWHILLISESMDHHDLEIMDDRSID